MIPTLATERLILRPYAVEDFDGYASFVGSDEAVYMDGPHDRGTAWDWFCHDVASWHLFGHGSLTIEDLRTWTSMPTRFW